MPNDDKNLGDNLKDMFQKVTGTVDYTNKFKSKEREENVLMAVLSYIIPPIPFIVERHSGYVKFHSNQGMNLFVWGIIVLLFGMILGTAFPGKGITNFYSLLMKVLYMALAAIGIVNALQAKAKELPLVSKLNLIDIANDFFNK